jgi:Rrf2 family protein
MLDLALKHGKGPIFLKEVSRSQEISEKYLGQIVMPLKAAGLVKSFRGAHGGYTLQRDPDKITVREIVATLEGDLNLVECVVDPGSCKRFAGCELHDLKRSPASNPLPSGSNQQIVPAQAAGSSRCGPPLSATPPPVRSSCSLFVSAACPCRVLSFYSGIAGRNRD